MAEIKLADVECGKPNQRLYTFKRGNLEILVPVTKVGTKVNYKITNGDLLKLSDMELEFIKTTLTDEEQWKR